MKPRCPVGGVALLLLVGAAGAVLTFEGRAQRRRDRHAEQFQHLVGGLGFGPAVDLSGCAFGLDPRLDGDCAGDYGPVPGGRCLCPRHTANILYYPPLGPRSGGGHDAPP
jgi:hypothetical protein